MVSSADIHAIILLGLAASTVVFVALKGRRPTLHRLLVALPLTTLFWLFHAATGLHRCRAGAPWREGLIAAGCLFLVLLFVESNTLRTSGALMLASAFGALAVHYLGLVHDDGWIANRRAPYEVIEQNRSMLEKVRSKAAEVAKQSAQTARLTSPAGWLCKLPPIADVLYPHRKVPLVLPRIEISDVWHTPFTGLLRTTPTYRGLWYPGGPLGQAAGRIALRKGGPKECCY